MNKLEMILWRDTDGKLKFWACRGESKGCARNKYRTSKKPCDDCVRCDDENETLGELQARLARGDA